ncbi:hypothetical protein [Streptomyces sp. NBC_01320]|uniref:hypothetical protein n=1 Tax=Streptomyces sp. NBC_01320 TaxID=2903824 RepID=UPI003FA38A87
MERGIDPDEETVPLHVVWASFLAFTAGVRLLVTVASVLAGLVITGWRSACLGAAKPGRGTRGAAPWR